MPSRSINILIGSGIRKGDKESFFGPAKENDEFFEAKHDDRWPDVLVQVGLMQSKSQAKRSGWNKDIEEGFNSFTFGKLKHRISVLKILKSSFLYISNRENRIVLLCDGESIQQADEQYEKKFGHKPEANGHISCQIRKM